MHTMMWTKTNTAFVATILILLAANNRILSIPVSPTHITVTEGQSFTFTCGPSGDDLEGISITLNDNMPSDGIVDVVNDTSPDGVMEYRYRNTTADDDDTRIVCSAGQDEGFIYLTVFYGPIINLDMSNFTIEEGRILTIALSVNANPQPDLINMYYQSINVSDVFINLTVIEFMSISRNQTGEYSLKISNNISTALYNFTVNVTYGPEFIDPILPSYCYPIGTTATYNCSAESVVVGNPQPSLRANVTQSEMNLVEVEVAVDTVTTNGSTVAHSIVITCVADNGVEPVVTAVGSLNFGRAAEDAIPMSSTDAGVVTVTWEAQTNTGCADVTYHGEVFLLDKIIDSIPSFNINRSIMSFNTTENSYIIGNLCPETYYQISLRAANELGISGYSNVTVMTNKTRIAISGMKAMRRESNEVEITWNLNTGGVTNLTITIIYQKFINGATQENEIHTVNPTERMAVLHLEVDSKYNITLHVTVTCKPDMSASDSIEVYPMDDSGTEHMLSVIKLWHLIVTTILVLVVVHTL